MKVHNMKIGDKYLYVVDDFDGYSEEVAIVTEVHEDHAIMKTEICDHLWYEVGVNDYMFIKIA